MYTNSAYNSDEVLDFLMEADLVDLFSDAFHTRPPTYSRGSQQIDIFAGGSLEIIHYLPVTYILDPTTGEGDHLTFGGDLHFGGLINCNDLQRVDTTNDQYRQLTLTDIKARMKYLKKL